MGEQDDGVASEILLGVLNGLPVGLLAAPLEAAQAAKLNGDLSEDHILDVDASHVRGEVEVAELAARELVVGVLRVERNAQISHSLPNPRGCGRFGATNTGCCRILRAI